jgi:predicted ATPase
MLEKITLRGFKSFADADINLGSFTMIVGANASGKSNVRDALKLLHGVGLGYTLAEIIGEKYGPGGVLVWRGIRGGVREVATHGRTQFSIGCDIRHSKWGVEQYSVSVDVSSTTTGPRVVAESLRQHEGPYYWDSNPQDDPVSQTGDHQIWVRHPRGGDHRRHGKISAFASSRPVVAQMPALRDADKAARQASTRTLETLQSMRFLDLDPEAMRQPSQPGQIILGDRGENLSSVLQSICNDPKLKQTLLSWVRALTPMDATDFEFVPDFSGRVLVYLVESTGARVSAISASDGTLRFLALVAALLSPDSGRLYFFEEFDNGIHPTRLHLLLRLVQQACKHQNIQVVGTTHNPVMLAFLDDDARDHALLVYRPETSPYSKVRRIMDLPDIERILETQDLGRLHAAGWLEDAAAFSDPEEPEQPDQPGQGATG